MKILAIDLGQVRTGIAMSDENEVLATPICTIKEKNREALVEKISEICRENNVSKIVLGLPKNMDGTEGNSAKNSRKFGDLLNQRLDISIVYWDERRTTVTANSYMHYNKVSLKKRKNLIDTIAATVILQSYLDREKNYDLI